MQKPIILSTAITQSAETIPTTIPIQVNKSADFVRWGDRNEMGDRIYDIAMGSPTQSAIIRAINCYVIGAGVEYDTLEQPNPEQSWDDLVRLVVQDCVVYSMFGLQVILNNDGQTASLYHQPISTIRVGKIIDEYGNFDQYLLCADWNKYSKRNSVAIKRFDGELKSGEPQLAVFKDMSNNDRYYATPKWWSVAPLCEADKQLAKFFSSEVSGAFRGQTVITFPYSVDEETQQDIYTNIKESFIGSDSQNSVLCLFSEGDKTPEVNVVNPPNHDVFNGVATQIQYSICSANRISPQLAGLSINSGFSAQSEILLASHSIFQLTVCNEIRRFVLNALNGLLHKVGNDNGKRNQLKFVDFDLRKEFEGLTNVNDSVESDVNDTEGMSGIEME